MYLFKWLNDLKSSESQYDNDEFTPLMDDACPICGVYTPDGQVCNECIKEYKTY